MCEKLSEAEKSVYRKLMTYPKAEYYEGSIPPKKKTALLMPKSDIWATEEEVKKAYKEANRTLDNNFFMIEGIENIILLATLPEDIQIIILENR